MTTYVRKAKKPEGTRGSFSPSPARWGELIGLVLASLALFYGAYRVYVAKSAHPDKPSFSQIEQQIAEKKIVPLNEVASWRELAPLLPMFQGEEQQFAAEAIADHVRRSKYEVPNVGELNKLRLPRASVASREGLPFFRSQLEDAIANEREAQARRERRLRDSPIEALMSIFSHARREAPADFAPFANSSVVGRIKPNLIVRRPAAFTSSILRWFGLLLAAFFIVHIIWRRSAFAGDPVFLPVMLLLCGLGFLMMVSLRDPLRDTMSFRDFSLGVLLGCAGLLAASLSHRWPLLRQIRDRFRKNADVPLLLALGLSILLIFYGSGPGGSDAKVNLGPLQPVEFIKILVVIYLAAYFDRHWEFLRYLREQGEGLFSLLGRWNAPRLLFFLPVVIAMGLVLLFFFMQKDLGPALILGSTFLSMYAVARRRTGLIVVGLSMLGLGLSGAYWLGQPETVVKRIDIYRNLWENGLRGGDQIAHSLWALSTGGVTGTGLGLGDPGIIPAGHTDLILASIGEELGFAGLLLVMLLYAVFILRALRAALRSSSDYDFFLALGLALITAWQILLIATGILGLFPLSGVVSPFLSWGKSSMIANFVIAGLILAVSAQSSPLPKIDAFEKLIKWLGGALALLGIVVIGTAAYYQILRADETVLKGSLVQLRDRSYAFQYNRRLLDAAKALKIGAILDRNGIPLATADCQDLIAHRAELESLGITPEIACKQTGARLYPFGPPLFHMLGDLNTRENWSSPNTIYVEREYYSRLHGFDDHAKLAPRDVRLSKEEIEAARREADVQADRDIEPDAGEDRNEGVANLARSEVDDEAPRKEAPSILPGERTRRVQVLERDYREILPLLRHRYQKDHPAVAALLARDRTLRLSIDVRLQMKLAELLAGRLKEAAVKRGAAVVLDPATGDVLAAVSYPWPGMPFTLDPPQPGESAPPKEEWIDRVFTGLRPPGSTFKIVTAMAALRHQETDYRAQRFGCEPLGGGRVGKVVPGFNRPVRDSEGDRAHGAPDLEAAIIESCNAYFAQLGIKLGAADLKQTADQFEIRVASAREDLNTVEELMKGENLLQGAYGQGRVIATPFQMGRVAATVAGGGAMPHGRWVIDDGNRRSATPLRIVSPDRADFLVQAMRGVVTRGTARTFAASSMAGKTGTAQVVKRVRITKDGKLGLVDAQGQPAFLDWKPGDPIPAGLRPSYRYAAQPSHGWFIGFAPYDAPRRIAFSVLIENGGFGGRVAAPIANEIVLEAKRLGLIQ